MLEGLASYPKAKKGKFKKWNTRIIEDWGGGDEASIQALITRELERDFIIHEYVKGRHFSGSTLTIDTIIVPKSTSKWKNKKVALGIEFKAPKRLESKCDYTYWAKQAVDYTHTLWDGFGYISVFLGPGNSRLFWGGKSGFIGDFLASYKVGWMETNQGIQFRISGKRVWCQTYGVQEIGKKSNLVPTFGRQK